MTSRPPWMETGRTHFMRFYTDPDYRRMCEQYNAFEAGVKEAMAKVAAQTAGEAEAETSAPGLGSTSYAAVDVASDQRRERAPGNAKKGRGVPEWIRYAKDLPSSKGKGNDHGRV